jgi:hypothetical protein
MLTVRGGIMKIEIFRSVLAWCSAIDLALLVLWYLFFSLAHDWMYRYHTKWFKKLSVEAFDAIHYAGMALFKIGILLFNLAPYFALRIVS